jgi:hypothetical protein
MVREQITYRYFVDSGKGISLLFLLAAGSAPCSFCWRLVPPRFFMLIDTPAAHYEARKKPESTK